MLFLYLQRSNKIPKSCPPNIKIACAVQTAQAKKQVLFRVWLLFKCVKHLVYLTVIKSQGVGSYIALIINGIIVIYEPT